MSTTRKIYGPWYVPLYGGGLAIVAALACWVTPVPWWAPPTIGGVGALTTFLLAWFSRHGADWRVTSFLLCWWLAPPAWAVWIDAFGLSWANVIVLPCAVLAGTLWGLALAPHGEAPPPSNLGLPMHPRQLQIRDLLDRRFKTATLAIAPDGTEVVVPGFRVTRFKMWPGDNGYNARVAWPMGYDLTMQKIKEAMGDIEAAIPLPEGCMITVSPAEHKGACNIAVMLINALVEVREYPAGVRPRSIKDRIRIGWLADNSLWEFSLLRKIALFVGMRGGGKTTALHDVIAECVQCTDDIIVVFDLNGGGVANAWMRDFAMGLVEVPPIEIVAVGEDQAIEVAGMLKAMALSRKSAYASLMAEHNTDTMPTSADHPHVTVIVDEIQELFGDNVTTKRRRAAKFLLDVMQLGRAAGFDFVLASQRSVSTYLPADVRKNVWTRSCTLVVDDEELGQALGWKTGLTCADLTSEGEYFTRTRPSEPPRKAKSYRILPAQISKIVRAVQHWRPELDEITVRAGGRVWADRWEMMTPWLRSLVAGADPDEAPLVDVEEILAGPQTPAQVGKQAAQDIADALRVKEAALRAAAEPPTDQAEFEASVRADLDRWPVLTEERNTTPPDPEMGKGPAFLLQLLRDAGPDGMTTGKMFDAAEAAGISRGRRPTINDWLSKLRKFGLAESPRDGQWVAADRTQATE